MKWITAYYHTAMRHYEMTSQQFGSHKGYEFYSQVGKYISKHGLDRSAEHRQARPRHEIADESGDEAVLPARDRPVTPRRRPPPPIFSQRPRRHAGFEDKIVEEGQTNRRIGAAPYLSPPPAFSQRIGSEAVGPLSRLRERVGLRACAIAGASRFIACAIRASFRRSACEPSPGRLRRPPTPASRARGFAPSPACGRGLG